MVRGDGGLGANRNRRWRRWSCGHSGWSCGYRSGCGSRSSYAGPVCTQHNHSRFNTDTGDGSTRHLESRNCDSHSGDGDAKPRNGYTNPRNRYTDTGNGNPADRSNNSYARDIANNYDS
jgi:hypothetical protein